MNLRAGIVRGFARLCGAMLDRITDSARSPRPLQGSEERLRQAARVAHIGIFDHDQIADTIYWSPEQREIYGLSPHEPVTLQVYLEHVFPGDLDRIGAAVARAHDPAGDGLFDIEHRIVRADGSVRWLETRARTFFEGEGPARRPVRTVGAVLDVTERRNVEETRALLAAVVETTSDAIIVTRPQMEIVSWNSGAERMFGWAAAEAVGRSHSLIVPPELQREPQRNTQLLEKGEAPPTFETVRLTRDGRRLNVQVSISGIYDENGELKLVAGIFRDVTERKLFEEERARLAAIVENSSDAIVGRTLDGVVRSWNAAAERLFGYRAAEIIGKDIGVIVPPDRREEVEQKRAQLAQGKPGPSYDTVRLAKDGRRIEVSATQSPIRNEKGELTGVSLIFRDITERKEAEEALHLSEQRFRALVELSSDWYWQTDEEHRFIFREGAVLQRMGIPPEADYGIRRWEMKFVNMSDADWARHREVLERREEFRDLLFGRVTPSGRVFWATISGKPLYDPAGEFIGYHGTGRDVTAQVLAEQALRESEAQLRRLNEDLERKVAERTAELAASNKELEAFAYSVSHDLRAPLRAIDGFCRVLFEDYGAKLDTEALGYLDRVRNAVQRMGGLIDDMLQLSRVARVEMRPEAVDLSRLAQEILAQLQAAAPERRVEVLIGSALSARGDPRLLGIALNNLLENAWKYTSKTADARIEFTAAADDGERVFCVKDNGAGFDMQYADKLFGAFQRLHSEREFPGTGVGLATVARIVHRHGGRVWATGEPRKGASFFFALPSEAKPPARQ
jgi:PAS domain S-box-containing protein